MPKLPRRRCLLTLLGSMLPAVATGAQTQPVVVEDTTWIDAARAQRAVPLRIRWPAAEAPVGPAPVLLFSHGLGGTRDGGAIWGQAWAEAGFVVLHLQHPGSDWDAVRASAGAFNDLRGLRAAASPAQLLARLRDVRFALDEIARRHAAGEGRWAWVRPQRIGMSGHSFGAHTTLGMAGQRYPGFDPIDEPRLAAFVAFSPSLPAAGDARQAFAGIARPLLAITGTRDDDVVGNGATPERRIAVFDALPAGGKAQLVLRDADHMTFAGQAGRAAEFRARESVTRELQASHHRLVAGISTDWWRATLQDDAAARLRLQDPQGLGTGDRWRRK